MSDQPLDASLTQLWRDLPGCDRASRLLRLARIRAVEQIDALRIKDAAAFADLVLQLATHFDPSLPHWPELAGAKEDLCNFWEICGASIPEVASSSRRLRRHGILHTGGESAQAISEAAEVAVAAQSSALAGDRKRRRIFPAEVNEILPPPPAEASPSIADWEAAQHRFWIYRLARIAQRAGGRAGIWEAIQKFDPIDRDRLWDDTLGASEWRTTRAICYAFEALERWAIKVGRSAEIFPASIRL